MKKVAWLHLTDLHCGMTDQLHLWPNVRKAFYDDMQQMHDKTGPWPFVFFTGDLVQCGSSDEFKRLNSLLISIWDRFHELGSDPVLLAVPGNHDLQRPNAKLSAVRLLAKWDQNTEIHHEFWEDSGSEYRKTIDDAFANFCNWLHECSFSGRIQLHEGLIAGDFSVSLNLDEFRIGVVGLNTSFLQLTSGNYKRRLVWNHRQLEIACEGDAPSWVGAHDFCVLLTHHGPSWLNKDSLEKQLAEISPAGRFLLHLYGHMHEPEERNVAADGGPMRRQHQGEALFGLKEFGEEEKQTRLHGYSISTLELDSESRRAYLRHWPRSARFHHINGWEIIPNHSVFSLEDDGGTRAEEIKLPEIKTVKWVSPQSLTGITADANYAIAQHSGIPSKSGRIEWPRDDPHLRPYCDEISKAHGHIRFVEIPQLQDTSDVELDSLYVIPMCVFRSNPATIPSRFQPLIPVQTGHRSGAFRPPLLEGGLSRSC